MTAKEACEAANPVDLMLPGWLGQQTNDLVVADL